MNVEVFKFLVINDNINFGYMISNFGTIINVEKDNRILKQSNSNGYKVVRICDKLQLVHRLVLVSFLGNKEHHMCDHINGMKDDNRLQNLRWATSGENNMNRKLGRQGHKGVSYNKKCNKYVSYITCGGIRRYLGLFEDINDAKIAYNNKALELFGKFAKLNEI